MSQPFPILGFVVYGVQPLPEMVTLSTADNTFHIYRIGLNRNRMTQAFCQNGYSAKPTSEMIYCSRGHFDLLIQAANFII